MKPRLRDGALRWGGILIFFLLASGMLLGADALAPVCAAISNDLQRLETEPNPSRDARRQIAALRSALAVLVRTNSAEWRLAVALKRLPASRFASYREPFDLAAGELSTALHENAASIINLIGQLPPRPGQRAAQRAVRPLLKTLSAEEAALDPWVRAGRLLRCRLRLDAAGNAAHRVLAPLEALPENSLQVKIGWDAAWPDDPERNRHFIWDNFNWLMVVAAGRTPTNLTIFPYTHAGDCDLMGGFFLEPGAYRYALPAAGLFLFSHPINPVSFSMTSSSADGGVIYAFTNATHVFGVIEAQGSCSVRGRFNARIQAGSVQPPWWNSNAQP